MAEFSFLDELMCLKLCGLQPLPCIPGGPGGPGWGLPGSPLSPFGPLLPGEDKQDGLRYSQDAVVKCRCIHTHFYL